MFEGFTDQRIEVSTGVGLRVRMAGKGPAVLLLHGYPQTHVCWHKVAPLLVDAGYTVVVSDLRGYGDSDKPVSSADHNTYSKREMAADQVEMMAKLGFDEFCLAGHDRGARVSYRLALDHSHAVKRLALLDIAPTATMYERTDRAFATGYFHWFFLIQPAPFPETLIGNCPEFTLRAILSSATEDFSGTFPDEAMEEYIRCYKDPASLSATCEDYRAAATIDLVHDEEDADKRLQMPLLVMWGSKGLVGKLYDVEAIWREKASDVTALELPAGHFIPEELPKKTAAALVGHFKA